MLVSALASAAAMGWWFSSKAHEKPEAEKVAVILPLTRIYPVEENAAREPVSKRKERDVPAAGWALSRRDNDQHSDNIASHAPPLSTPEQALASLVIARPAASSQSGAYIKPRDSVPQFDRSAGTVDSPAQRLAAKPSVFAGPASDQKSAPKRADKPISTAAVESIELKLLRNLRVFHLEELPPEVRRDIPKLSATGYVYSADTGVRIVNVNERSLQEGDELAAGMKLEQIAPDHVLFSFRGYRFRVEMF
jgi:hypothetical protein